MNPQQIDREKNPFFSDKSVQFMEESLKDLDIQLKKSGAKGLNLYYGENLEVINDLLSKNKDIEGICVNEDYTPFSIKRDNLIEDLCIKNGIEFKSFMDIPLYNFYNIKTKGGTAYKRFKWFYKATQKMDVARPLNLSSQSIYSKIDPKSDYLSSFKVLKTKYIYSHKSIVIGGRKKALIGLEAINKLKNYKAIRQTPLIIGSPTSSMMSAYNKFGCISIREMYYKIFDLYGNEHELIRQMVWRDFYYNLVFNYPETFLTNSHSYIKDYIWENDTERFELWCTGNTGYTFVDASMRQLNSEGYMSNRGRLACASFLIRNLHIDWKWGERYFATKLIDYDPAQNNGNWQWVSSSGYESQAYYRYINVLKDQVEFDPECLYAKKYIDEIKDLDCPIILSGEAYLHSSYNEPIVDIKDSMNDFKESIKKIKGK
jgi:deoxyribodipyrimidine photo-lyase